MNVKKSTEALIFPALLLFLFLLVPGTAPAQNSNLATPALSASEVDRIIKAFTANESQFRNALNQYAFKRDALLQSLGMGGRSSGNITAFPSSPSTIRATASRKLVTFRCLHLAV